MNHCYQNAKHMLRNTELHEALVISDNCCLFRATTNSGDILMVKYTPRGIAFIVIATDRVVQNYMYPYKDGFVSESLDGNYTQKYYRTDGTLSILYRKGGNLHRVGGPARMEICFQSTGRNNHTELTEYYYHGTRLEDDVLIEKYRTIGKNHIEWESLDLQLNLAYGVQKSYIDADKGLTSSFITEMAYPAIGTFEEYMKRIELK